MSPGAQLGWALVLGSGLCVVYDFLRPLRFRHHAPADLCFVAVMVALWLDFNFGLCGGRIRFAPNFFLATGFFLWRLTLSRLTKAVFSRFWGGIFCLFRVITFPAKKFLQFLRKIAKKYLQVSKKRVQ